MTRQGETARATQLPYTVRVSVMDVHDALDLGLVPWFPRTAGDDGLEQLDGFAVGSDGGGYV